MRDALMNEAAWMTTRLKPCSLKVRAVCHSRVQSASSPLRKRSSFGRHHRQTSMIMRHQGTFATEMGQRAGAFHKKTLDPKIAFPIGMAKRHYQRGFLSIPPGFLNRGLELRRDAAFIQCSLNNHLAHPFCAESPNTRSQSLIGYPTLWDRQIAM